MYKICFITALFNNKLLDSPGKFERDPRYDYYLFTNLNANKFNTSWDIQTISNFPKCNNITMSRYFKFMAWEYFKSQGKVYDIIVYSDAYLSPLVNNNWQDLATKILATDGIQFMQHQHTLTITQELQQIIKCKKDTANNMEKTLTFLDNAFPIIAKIKNTEKIYVNTVFAYSPQSTATINHLAKFWRYYTNGYPTYRDQPLWAALFFDSNAVPIIESRMSDYFEISGVKNITHCIANYI